MSAADGLPAVDPVSVAQTELAGGAMGLGAVLAQALTHIAPAMGFLTGVTFIASQAGYSLSIRPTPSSCRSRSRCSSPSSAGS